jgi:pyruvate dehydrogenase E1 component alpha subunit
VTVDGNDILAVFATATAAVERARAGEGPTLIECKTYRHRAHTERIEVEDRRPPDEVEVWKQKDPIERLAMDLIQRQELTQSQFDAVEAEVLREIESAVEFAKASPFPEPQAALQDVYAE